MYFAIECLAMDSSGSKLYVTDSYPKVTGTVQQNKNFRNNQLWMALFNPNNGGVILKNKDSGNLLAVPSGNNPALLVSDSIENETKLSHPSAVLNITNTDGAGYKVIRGLQDQDNNLDLRGIHLTRMASIFCSGLGQTTQTINGASFLSKSNRLVIAV